MSSLRRWVARSDNAQFVIAFVLALPVAFVAAVVFEAVAGDWPPEWLVIVAVALLVVGGASVLDRWTGADQQPASPQPDVEAMLEAVDWDESRLPPEAGVRMDGSTPELWRVMKWTPIPAVVVALAAPGWSEPEAMLLLAFEVVALVFLALLGAGPVVGRVSVNDFAISEAYGSRWAAAWFRGQSVVFVGMAAGLLLHLTSVFGAPDQVIGTAAVALVALGLPLWLALCVAGRPRALLPALVRRFGPLTLWAPVPKPPLGHGRAGARIETPQ